MSVTLARCDVDKKAVSVWYGNRLFRDKYSIFRLAPDAVLVFGYCL